MDNEKREIRRARLEALKQATIINYGAEINYDGGLDLYETMVEHVFNGDLDDMFIVSEDVLNREETLKLARKYSSLCFYQGNIDYWLDSVEGISLMDPELVSLKILDNYDFLIRLAQNGEEPLKQLVNFKNTDFLGDKIIIDYLRTSFATDEILIDTIKSMSDKFGDYKEFSDEQKALLCMYPEGVLYRENEKGEYENIPSKKILSAIKINLLGEDNENFHLGDALQHLSMDDFEDIINKVYEDHKKESITSIKQ